jgi:hypothetical protein
MRIVARNQRGLPPIEALSFALMWIFGFIFPRGSFDFIPFSVIGIIKEAY